MRRGLLVAALLNAAACAQTFDTTTLGVPVTMASAVGEPAQGTAFRSNVTTLHGLFGLVTFSQANLQKALARQLIDGDEIAELRIRTRSRWSDVLLTVLTAGLIVPRTVTYQGVVVDRPPTPNP